MNITNPIMLRNSISVTTDDENCMIYIIVYHKNYYWDLKAFCDIVGLGRDEASFSTESHNLRKFQAVVPILVKTLSHSFVILYQ